MNPAAIIQQATADGVNLTLSPAGTIKAAGDAAAVYRWFPVIREFKPGILAALSSNDTPIAPDLEQLIVRTGTRWEYSPKDYDMIRATARRDPDGLRLALENDAFLEAYEERAAIMEYDGGFSRREAERLAAGAIPPPKR